jgi:arylsulfatase A-like enzyme
MASMMPFAGARFGVWEAPLTLAEMMRSTGYYTRGFHAANPFASAHFGYGRGFDRLDEFFEFTPAHHGALPEAAGGEGGGEQAPFAARLARPFLRACRALGRRLPGGSLLRGAWRPVDELLRHATDMRVKNALEETFGSTVRRWVADCRPGPFFLWAHWMTPHEPYVPPPARQREAGGPTLSRLRALMLRRAAGRGKGLTEAQRRDLVALYDGEVRRFDHELGRLLKVLRARGLLDPSLLIVTADHGEALGEHGRCFHPSLHYEELLGVPLIVRLPGQQNQRRSEGEVSLLDLMPTLADLVGAELPEDVCMGRSFAPLLRGEEPMAGDRLVESQSAYGEHEEVHRLRTRDLRRLRRRVSFQNSRLKLMVDPGEDRCRAFDLRADPREERDLAEAHPGLAQTGRALAGIRLREAERRRVRHTFPDGPPGRRP